MTTQNDNITDLDNEALGSLLREARDRKRMSRQELARRTSIPSRSIEKFEYGQQEPGYLRLRKLCRELELDMEGMNGTGTGNEPASPPPPTKKPVTVEAPPRSSGVDDPVSDAQAILMRLDDLRADDFDGGRRVALALVEDLKAKLRYLEPDELLALAEERGVHQMECPEVTGIFDLFTSDPDKAQQECGDVEERIVDTAILGADLFGIDKDALAGLADQLKKPYHLKHPHEFLFESSWGDHRDMVPLLRPILRTLALSGKPVNLGDQKTFPQRP